MTKNPDKGSKQEIRISSSLLKRASKDNQDAIRTMFQQFIPEAEEICLVRYLGLQGLWGFGNREFVCLTDRRVADITVGRFWSSYLSRWLFRTYQQHFYLSTF